MAHISLTPIERAPTIYATEIAATRTGFLEENGTWAEPVSLLHETSKARPCFSGMPRLNPGAILPDTARLTYLAPIGYVWISRIIS